MQRSRSANFLWSSRVSGGRAPAPASAWTIVRGFDTHAHVDTTRLASKRLERQHLLATGREFPLRRLLFVSGVDDRGAARHRLGTHQCRKGVCITTANAPVPATHGGLGDRTEHCSGGPHPRSTKQIHIATKDLYSPSSLRNYSENRTDTRANTPRGAPEYPTALGRHPPMRANHLSGSTRRTLIAAEATPRSLCRTQRLFRPETASSAHVGQGQLNPSSLTPRPWRGFHVRDRVF
jgi:hypothetical protein